MKCVLRTEVLGSTVLGCRGGTPVRSRIEVLLGSAVIAASTRVGGFSPGFAGVLTTDSGRTFFAKAVSTAQNPTTPALLLAERDISAAAIPANPHVPRLLHWVEGFVGDDEWVALISEAVSGSSPALPWERQDAVLVLRSLEQLCPISSRRHRSQGPYCPSCWLRRLIAGRRPTKRGRRS